MTMSFIKDIPSLMDKVCCSMWVEQLDEVWPRMVRHCRWVCCFVDDFMWVFKDYLLHLSSLHLFLCSISGPIKLKYLTQKLPSQNLSKTWDQLIPWYLWRDFFDVGKSSSNGRPSSNATKISSGSLPPQTAWVPRHSPWNATQSLGKHTRFGISQ